MPRRETLMIVGASTRAAAQSAVRSGRLPLCADHFLDEDLREIAEILPLDRYPEGLIHSLAKSPQAPWIYTGALENRPTLLEKLAALRPLLGNPADVVRAVRDPFRVCDLLCRTDLPALAVRPEDSPPEPDGNWLVKPEQGSAGRGIELWYGSRPEWMKKEPAYFQQRAAGKPISALFLATSAETVLIGATQQWVGIAALFAGPFSYCGSIGPVSLAESTRRQAALTGQILAAEFGLRGLFGIDCLLENDIAWLTEVNPRYTASVEIYELSLDLPLLEWHCRACASFGNIAESRQIVTEFRARLHRAEKDQSCRRTAKAILYAPFCLSAPDLAKFAGTPHFAAAGVAIADRPEPGLVIPEKAPICTLIARGEGLVGWATVEPALAELIGKLKQNPLQNQE